MEDVVAVEVTLDSGERRYFVTWGRIQDTVDPEPLEKLVVIHAAKVGLGGLAVSAKVCDTLAKAQSAPYFFEGLLAFSREPIPFGESYEAWRHEKNALMEQGLEIYFAG